MTNYDFRTASSKKPLYGHTDERTAYVIADYPSGFTARCRKRVWIDYNKSKGYRLVEQTSEKWYPGQEPAENTTLRWNKPKMSTYATLAACMYLDSQDHVQWDQLSGYADANKCLQFFKDFPEADHSGIKAMTVAQVNYCVKKLEGAVAMAIGNQVKAWTDAELGKTREDLLQWIGLAKEVGLKITDRIQDLADGKIEAKQVDVQKMQEDMLEEKKKKEDAAKEKAEQEAKKPGALSANDFVALVKKLAHIDGRTLKLKISNFGGHDSDVIINFYNIPENLAGGGGGAVGENNRLALYVEGFDVDADKPVGKVKVTTRIDNIGQLKDRAKTSLRGKTAAPEAIAKYVASHISSIVKEFEPSL